MSLTILLVEDDDPTARLLRLLLERVGMTVWRAKTVAEAMEAIELRPALIMLDLRLPDGSGVDVLKTVRARRLPCKVAVVSAASEPDLFSAVMAQKPDAIFGKPLDFDGFVDWMGSIFTEDPVVAYKLAG